ncbi:MAG: sigma-70 family RNA polymerase sigma factor [Acidaminobacteraceae bacterium]
MKKSNKNHLLLIDYVKNNQEKFYRTAYMYTKSKDDALDIVQEALLKALKSSHTILESKYIATWFYRILINTSITYINNRKVTCPLEFISETLKSKETNENENIDLYTALEKLDDLEKSIIMLRYFEDLKFKDIALVTGLNINTLKTRTYLILDKLKLQLECEVNNFE